MSGVFYWIGVAVVVAAAVAAVCLVAAWLYAVLIHRRFGLIFFRKSQRRLSIASWHQSRIIQKSQADIEVDWPADDWPICERPFYLSYEAGKRRYFVMAGWLEPMRADSIKGKRPLPTPVEPEEETRA